jgi:predicted PurR-regulated permease PerM
VDRTPPQLDSPHATDRAGEAGPRRISPRTLIPRIVRIEIAPRSVALVLATIVGVLLAYQLALVWMILIMALILAGTFHPAIEWMEGRGLRRIHALIVLFLALTVAAAVLLLLTIPPLLAQASEMLQNAPALRTRLIAFLNERAFTMPFAGMVQRAELDKTFAVIGNYLVGNSSLVARVIGYGATTLVLSFYLLADGERAQAVVYSIVPRESHARLARIFQKLEAIVGGYMRGQLITSAAIGVFTLMLLLVCRVPNALVLALFAALVDVLPFIGGLLVIVPAVLSALSRGLPVAIVVLVALLIYMEFESRILVPRVYGRVLRLSSTVVILALLAGGTLMGMLGALLALPIAAGLLMILEELHLELPGDDNDDRPGGPKRATT